MSELSLLQGKQWEPGAVGPDKFDCLGLVVYIQRKFFCRSVPFFNLNGLPKDEVLKLVRKHKLFKEWKLVENNPEHGDCILLSHTGDPFHIGVCLRINRTVGVLHCTRNFGVVFSTFQQLAMSAYSTQKIYRHKEQW